MKFFLRVFFLVILTGAVPGLAAAESPAADFSAEMVMTASGQTMQGKLYAAEGKSRMEMPQSVVITRYDRNVSWVIMPGQGMYMEQPIDVKSTAKTSRELPGETERVSLGTEQVGGQAAEKFKVTYMEGGRQESLYQWVAGDSPVPVKFESVDGTWSMEYRNINLEPQDDSLFEVPAGYQKFDMPDMGSYSFTSEQADR